MSVHKNPNSSITKISSKAPPRKAPVPQVDREHFAEMRRLERDPHYLDKHFSADPHDAVQTEKK